MNVAINGFGRIGRTFLRVILSDPEVCKNIKIISINVGPELPENLALLFKYDSLMGEFKGDVSFRNNKLIINENIINVYAQRDPGKLPWRENEIDWVVEASGCFVQKEKALAHCNAGAQSVLITAPSPDPDVTIIPGINDDSYDNKKHKIVSMGSCTTGAFAPLVKVLQESFGITQGLMTTVHAYTNDQVLLDVEHKDPRRARAAGINIIPTKTGADKVITKIFPDLEGRIKAIALRIPVALVSIIDFTFNSPCELTKEQINEKFLYYSKNSLKRILQYVSDPLVSSDFIGSIYSSCYDSLLTQCYGNIGKVFAWYDNEYGYSMRIKDFLVSLLKK
jgi:glyceraldehyde-3-phosphate dehydrogenase type I